MIGDRIGRKRVLMVGLALFGLGSLLSAYSHSPDQLIAARAAMGLGGAAVMPQTLSIIANVFEPQERAKAIGIWTSAVGIGVAIGPVLGGLLLTHFWWGSVFLINVPVTAVGLVAAFFLVPESRNPAPGRIDYVGVLGSVLGLVLLVYGVVQGGDGASWLSAGVLAPLLGGLAVLALFVWWESPHRAPQPRRPPVQEPDAVGQRRLDRAAVLRHGRRVLLHQLLPAERPRLQPAQGRRAGGAVRARPVPRWRRAAPRWSTGTASGPSASRACC